MLHLVAYDTDDDARRNRFAEYLKDMGGERIQYSAFLVDLSEEALNRLEDAAKRIFSGARARVFIMPICSRDEDRALTLIHNYRQLWDEESPLL